MTHEEGLAEKYETSTIGDECGCSCPWCGKYVSLQDAHTDGCLEEGYEDTCEHCGKLVEVSGVDYDITVTLWRGTAKP